MGKTLRELMHDHEREIVIRTMRANQGNYDLTAAALGVTRRALDKILLRHHLGKRRYTRALPIARPLQSIDKDDKDHNHG